MATFTGGAGQQGYWNKAAIADGETVVVHFDVQDMQWNRGDAGASVNMANPDSASVAVHDSLQPSGNDDWTPTPGSPFTEDRQFRETSRVHRKRFAPSGGGIVVVVLSGSGVRFEAV